MTAPVLRIRIITQRSFSISLSRFVNLSDQKDRYEESGPNYNANSFYDMVNVFLDRRAIVKPTRCCAFSKFFSFLL